MLLIVGIGIEEKDLTIEAMEALKSVKIVYASKRIAEEVRKLTEAEVREIKSFSAEFYRSICEEAKKVDIAVVSTGDPMVSGLGTKFPCDVKIISGISSVQKALAITTLCFILPES